MLKDVYIEAKKIDPECKILNGGFTESIPQSLKRLYKYGAGKYFDILSIHPFANPLNPNAEEIVIGIYNSCEKIMRANGDDKKIWITELGCPGVKSAAKENGWWAGVSPNEKQQAQWVKDIYLKLLPRMPGCEKIFWAFFRDCKGHWKNGVDYFGLVRWDLSKKPAFQAYRQAVKAWREKHPVRLIQTGN